MELQNHAYCPDLSEYAHFYYKGKVILDPWMNEKSQGLPWPNHESKESAVDPIKYYGMDIIEDYLVNLFRLRPEWAPEIAQRVKTNLNDRGRLIRFDLLYPDDIELDYKKKLNRIYGKEVRLIGWGD